MKNVAVKIARTFAFSFAGVFVPCLINVLTDASKSADWTVARAALISGVFAASAAALRAVAAYLPLFADDHVGMRKP